MELESEVEQSNTRWDIASCLLRAANLCQTQPTIKFFSNFIAEKKILM